MNEEGSGRDEGSPAEQVAALRSRVAELERRNAELEDLAATDWLTGLLNRRALDSRLAEEVARSTRYGRSLALIIIDLDGFHEVNNRGGHEAGDEILRRTAKALSAACRATDIVARFGGDEFAVALPDTGWEGALEVGERLRRSVAAATSGDIAVTASLGSAVYTVEMGGSEKLLRVADEALFRAKSAGGNRMQGPADSKSESGHHRLGR